MTQTTFTVQARSKAKPKQLRRQGIIPANIFGMGDSMAVEMTSLEFHNLYQEVGETGLVYVQVGDQQDQYPVLVEEVQTDPVSGDLIHVSFKQVNLTEKIQAAVPVETVGEFDVSEGVLMVVKDEIEVEALPADLPESFEIDVSVLTEIGQTIAYKDLEYDRQKVTLMMGEEGEEEPVVLVQEQREEEVEEPVAEEGEGGEEGAAASQEETGDVPAEEGGEDASPAESEDQSAATEAEK